MLDEERRLEDETRARQGLPLYDTTYNPEYLKGLQQKAKATWAGIGEIGSWVELGSYTVTVDRP